MLVFVYGSLRTDGDNSDKMRTACGTFQFPASTVDEYHKGYNGFFEYLLEMDAEGSGSSYINYIEGEVFDVPEDFIEYLDSFEDPLERKIIKVEFENNVYDVWCYFCNEINDC
jgi:gamma-glutamylcyclotransferase (GGCT)/AIG2-like uncharacterized protein YtfP